LQLVSLAAAQTILCLAMRELWAGEERREPADNNFAVGVSHVYFSAYDHSLVVFRK
jgi:hypothetical protein